MSFQTVDEIMFVNALEILETERKIRELRVAEQEAHTAKAISEREAQRCLTSNLQEAHKTDLELRALQLAAQKAITEKTEFELRTQKIVFELTEEHQRTVSLPELKLS